MVRAITDDNKISPKSPEDAWDYQKTLLWIDFTQMYPTNFNKA